MYPFSEWMKSLAVIDLLNNELLDAVFPLEIGPAAMAVSPDGLKMYIADFLSSKVMVYRWAVSGGTTCPEPDDTKKLQK